MIQNFTEWLFFAPNIVSIIIIGVLSEVFKTIVLGDKKTKVEAKYTGLKRVYFITYKAQAIVIGAIIGLLPGIMVPESFQGEGIAGSILNYAGTGAAAMVFYSAIISNIKSHIRSIKT